MRVGHLVRQFWLGRTSKSSAHYWERRYRAGMNSGAGSYGEAAIFKAKVLNEFVRKHGICTVIELGCGDGNQLSLAQYPRYLGFDVSRTAIEKCERRFRSDTAKSFICHDLARDANLASFVAADLTLSLDVVYHLIEDDIYRGYLHNLFSTALRFAIVYSSNQDGGRSPPHVRHRKFTADVERDWPEFRLVEKIDNRHPDRSFADFYVFERSNPEPGVLAKGLPARRSDKT